MTFEAAGMGSTDLSIQNLRLLSPSGEEMETWVREGSVDVYPHGSISGVILDALKYQGDGLVVVGISKEMANDDVSEFARSQMSYTVLLDSAEVFQTYGVSSIPCICYIGEAGKIQQRHLGYRDGPTLEANARTLLAEE